MESAEGREGQDEGGQRKEQDEEQEEEGHEKEDEEKKEGEGQDAEEGQQAAAASQDPGERRCLSAPWTAATAAGLTRGFPTRDFPRSNGLDRGVPTGGHRPLSPPHCPGTPQYPHSALAPHNGTMWVKSRVGQPQSDSPHPSPPFGRRGGHCLFAPV